MPHAAPPTPLPRHHPNPHRGVAPALLAAVLGYLLLSAWVYAPAWERAFRSDASPVAWLSSALLLTLSITALRLLGERALPRLLGAWLAVAFLALALDEQFMLHELWKFRCHEWTTACQHSAVREAPMLAVAPTPTCGVAAFSMPAPIPLTNPAPQAQPRISPLRITTSPLMPFLPMNETWPWIFWSMMSPSFLQLMFLLRTIARSLETSPHASRPTKQPVKSYSWSLGICTWPIRRSCIGAVFCCPVTAAFVSAPSITMALAKEPEGI